MNENEQHVFKESYEVQGPCRELAVAPLFIKVSKTYFIRKKKKKTLIRVKMNELLTLNSLGFNALGFQRTPMTFPPYGSWKKRAQSP